MVRSNRNKYRPPRLISDVAESVEGGAKLGAGGAGVVYDLHNLISRIGKAPGSVVDDITEHDTLLHNMHIESATIYDYNGEEHALSESFLEKQVQPMVVKIPTYYAMHPHTLIKECHNMRMIYQHEFLREYTSLHQKFWCVIMRVKVEAESESIMVQFPVYQKYDTSLEKKMKKQGENMATLQPKLFFAVEKCLLMFCTYIEGMGYIYKDIKPANILCQGDDRAVISDFGSLIPLIDSSYLSFIRNFAPIEDEITESFFILRIYYEINNKSKYNITNFSIPFLNEDYFTEYDKSNLKTVIEKRVEYGITDDITLSNTISLGKEYMYFPCCITLFMLAVLCKLEQSDVFTAYKSILFNDQWSYSYRHACMFRAKTYNERHSELTVVSEKDVHVPKPIDSTKHITLMPMEDHEKASKEWLAFLNSMLEALKVEATEEDKRLLQEAPISEEQAAYNANAKAFLVPKHIGVVLEGWFSKKKTLMSKFINSFDVSKTFTTSEQQQTIRETIMQKTNTGTIDNRFTNFVSKLIDELNTKSIYYHEEDLKDIVTETEYNQIKLNYNGEKYTIERITFNDSMNTKDENGIDIRLFIQHYISYPNNTIIPLYLYTGQKVMSSGTLIPKPIKTYINYKNKVRKVHTDTTINKPYIIFDSNHVYLSDIRGKYRYV
jgi:serine/threonine protein kinase